MKLRFLSLLVVLAWQTTDVCLPLTVFIYMDSSDTAGNLSDMAIKNLVDMTCGGSNENVCFVGQLHAYGTTALRFKIEKGSIAVIDTIKLTGACKDTIVDAATWAFSAYPADHHMLIFWNHGYGILDPTWNDKEKDWLFEPDISDTIIDELIFRKRLRLDSIRRGLMTSLNHDDYLRMIHLLGK